MLSVLATVFSLSEHALQSNPLLSAWPLVVPLHWRSVLNMYMVHLVLLLTHVLYERVLCAGVPFGGYKDSGIGREKSEYALRAYTQVKAVYQPIKDPKAWH